jgi:hypothetical protein
MTSTIKFATFPFTHKGINFISKIAETNRFLPQIMLMGEDFITMNKGAVDEILEITDETTREELVEMLAHINEGGTEMFLELAGE